MKKDDKVFIVIQLYRNQAKVPDFFLIIHTILHKLAD
jgi:hypothetical protein